MRLVASAIAAALFLAAGSARAFDATGADIIGLRLGMSESDVVSWLAVQGYAARGGPDVITAGTKDGHLRVVLSAEQGVTEIIYVFEEHDVGDPAKIRDSVLNRFGDPNQATPPTWCHAPRPDGICPGNQASLTFLPDSMTLRLTAGKGNDR